MAIPAVDERDLGAMTFAKLQDFDINSATLKQAHKRWLFDNIIPLLQRGGSVSLVGLASRTGKASHNDALSKRRSEAVRQFLTDTVQTSFPFDVVDGWGEQMAADMGFADNSEDASFRAVMVYAHEAAVPPDPKTVKPKKKTPKPKKKPAKKSTVWIGIGDSVSGDLVAVGRYGWFGTVFRMSLDEDGFSDFAKIASYGWKLGGGLGGSVSSVVVFAHSINHAREFSKGSEWSDWDVDVAMVAKLSGALKGLKHIDKMVETYEQYQKLSNAAMEITKNKAYIKKGVYTIPLVGAGAHLWTGRKYGGVELVSFGRTRIW